MVAGYGAMLCAYLANKFTIMVRGWLMTAVFFGNIFFALLTVAACLDGSGNTVHCYSLFLLSSLHIINAFPPILSIISF